MTVEDETAAGDATPRRWLWLTTVADLDGPGRALSAVLSRWPAPDALAVCSLRTISTGFRKAIPATIDVIELGMRGTFDARVLSRLRRVCRTWKPHVLHTQLSRADWIGRVAGRMLGIPVVSTIHNCTPACIRRSFQCRWDASADARSLNPPVRRTNRRRLPWRFKQPAPPPRQGDRRFFPRVSNWGPKWDGPHRELPKGVGRAVTPFFLEPLGV